MAKADTPELVAAAQTIENHQKRLEELARALQKTKLQTEKNISRAARELQDALGQQEVLAVSLRALGEAMLHMQERQQAAVNILSERAGEIQTRRTRLSELMIRYASLGSKAAELLEAMSARVGQPTQGEAVAQATKRLDAIIEEATSLSRDAREEDFTEIAHEADVLKQKFQSIRTRLSSAMKTVN
jgi:chromosome segregation ATPase